MYVSVGCDVVSCVYLGAAMVVCAAAAVTKASLISGALLHLFRTFGASTSILVHTSNWADYCTTRPNLLTNTRVHDRSNDIDVYYQGKNNTMRKICPRNEMLIKSENETRSRADLSNRRNALRSVSAQLFSNFPLLLLLFFL